MNIALILSGSGLTVGASGFLLNWWRRHIERQSDTFIQVSDHVRNQYSRLNALALSQSHAGLRSEELAVLSKPGWILTKPASLESVKITLARDTNNDWLLEKTRRRAQKLTPRRMGGSRYSGYSQAMTQLGKMQHVYNGRSYRILAVRADGDSLALDFEPGWYFDHLDTSVILAYEVGARVLAGKRRVLGGPYRNFLGDPFDLNRRASGLGVNTLTIRRSAEGCGFYMHRRDGRWVTEGPELIHVIPAGEFTPSDVGLDALNDDFDIWRNIMREYAEEFLNIEEAYGQGGRPIDYAADTPYKQLQNARRMGQVSIHVLGIGLDSLDWKPSLLTVCIFESRAFDKIFGNLAKRNKEGTIIMGPNGRGIPFTEEAVRQYADSPNVLNSGASCLTLTWRHRVELGLSN